MGADLGGAAALIAVVIVGGLVTFVRWRRARLRQEQEARAAERHNTRMAIMMVTRGRTAELSDQERALARAWYLEQYAKTGSEEDLQRVIELREREG